jgi:AcrR family transcriptional regulator
MNRRPNRKNDPEAVRARLLDCAASLVVEEGLQTLTLEKVATLAGVSKGGLLYHYASKDALIAGLFAQVVEWFESRVDQMMAPDPETPARFSLAYLRVIADIDMTAPEERRLAVLILMLSSNPHFCATWNAWVEARLRSHRRTDLSPYARILRLAADGLWLSELGGGPDSRPEARAQVIKYLGALASEPVALRPSAQYGDA